MPEDMSKVRSLRILELLQNWRVICVKAIISNNLLLLSSFNSSKCFIADHWHGRWRNGPRNLSPTDYTSGPKYCDNSYQPGNYKVADIASFHDTKHPWTACEIAFATLGYHNFERIDKIGSSQDCQTLCQKNMVRHASQYTLRWTCQWSKDHQILTEMWGLLLERG